MYLISSAVTEASRGSENYSIVLINRFKQRMQQTGLGGPHYFETEFSY